jgi:hypothetical protein
VCVSYIVFVCVSYIVFVCVCVSYIVFVCVCLILCVISETRTKATISRRRWEDNIKMDLQEVGHVDMDWIELVQNRAS